MAINGLRQQMDVRFCGEQEPPAERQSCARRDLMTNCALSRACPGYLCFSLTVDSHGCRQSGHLDPTEPLVRAAPPYQTVHVTRSLSSNLARKISRTEGKTGY